MTIRQALTFADLRAANIQRIRHFKNRFGAPAHSKPDGSDWSPAQWLQATIGELGEFAEVRLQFERGEISAPEYQRAAQKELADAATYLSLLALRALDSTNDEAPISCAGMFMRIVAKLGDYANRRKKFDRGEEGAASFAVFRADALPEVVVLIEELTTMDIRISANDDKVINASPHGVILDSAIIDKFNEVSERVGSPVRIGHRGVYAQGRP